MGAKTFRNFTISEESICHEQACPRYDCGSFTSWFMAMSLSALAEEPRRPGRRGRRRCATTTAASTRIILTTVCGRSGARIPTGVGGDAAAIGGGLTAIGISMANL